MPENGDLGGGDGINNTSTNSNRSNSARDFDEKDFRKRVGNYDGKITFNSYVKMQLNNLGVTPNDPLYNLKCKAYFRSWVVIFFILGLG